MSRVKKSDTKQTSATRAANNRSVTKAPSARRKGKIYAYALPESAARKFLETPPPAGVQLALVAASASTIKTLKEWTDGEKLGEVDVLAAPRAEIEAAAYAPSSRARALLRGIRIAQADLLEAGGTYSLTEVQTLLNNVSRQAVEKRVGEGSLLAVPGSSNRRRYPTMQFTPEGVVPGLKKVLDALPTRDPWAVLNFLVRPDDRLGRRKPIDALREGYVDLVTSVARGVGVQSG